MTALFTNTRIFFSRLSWVFIVLILPFNVFAQVRNIGLFLRDYEDRVQAIWTAQMLGAMMGWPFEHKAASAAWVSNFNKKYTHAPVDDDWYYEMVAVRAFEKYGVNMTVEQLGKQWLENSAGSWGSSEQARLLMMKGIMPPECGEPRYNKLWFTIGSQFSSDVYGALAPAMPNLAAKIARKYGHINGYAEGADGGVFIAGMISLAFCEGDIHKIVRKASYLIDSRSPYRKCLDMVINMADKGRSAREIFGAVEDQWHIEYPATNNAVANGGIVATSLLFGEEDFLKTVNLAYGAADFTDADCNAANAGSVIAAIKGMKGLPPSLVNSLGDKIIGNKMGKVKLTPAVDESISALARRTANVGVKLLQENGVGFSNGLLTITVQEPATQPAELFELSDLTQFWNPDWLLERAGFGGAGGGMRGIRGLTYLDSNMLSTYPRDEVRGVELSRTLEIKNEKELTFDVGADSQRVWELIVFINNRKMVDQMIEGNSELRKWYHINVDISSFADKTVKIRLYQKVLIPGKLSGNAYWKDIKFL